MPDLSERRQAMACPHCGQGGFRSENELQTHIYWTHGAGQYVPETGENVVIPGKLTARAATPENPFGVFYEGETPVNLTVAQQMIADYQAGRQPEAPEAPEPTYDPIGEVTIGGRVYLQYKDRNTGEIYTDPNPVEKVEAGVGAGDKFVGVESRGGYDFPVYQRPDGTQYTSPEAYGRTEGVGAGGAEPMSEWQQWQTQFLPWQAQQEYGLEQQGLGQQQQNILAQMATQPASWLQYAATSGQPPVVQPWQIPLMPQEYAGLEGLRAGQPIPGWPEQFTGTNAQAYGGGYGQQGYQPFEYQPYGGGIPTGGGGVPTGGGIPTGGGTAPVGGVSPYTPTTPSTRTTEPLTAPSLLSPEQLATMRPEDIDAYIYQYIRSQPTSDLQGMRQIAPSGYSYSWDPYSQMSGQIGVNPEEYKGYIKGEVSGALQSRQRAEAEQLGMSWYDYSRQQQVVGTLNTPKEQWVEANYMQYLPTSGTIDRAKQFAASAFDTMSGGQTAQQITTGGSPLSERVSTTTAPRTTTQTYPKVEATATIPAPTPTPAPAPAPTKPRPVSEAEEISRLKRLMPSYEYGGWAIRPQTARLAEKEPELVTPLSQLTGGGGSSWLDRLRQMQATQTTGQEGLTPAPALAQTQKIGTPAPTMQPLPQTTTQPTTYQSPAMPTGTPPQAMGQYPLGGMPELTRPSRQYQARMSPSMRQQYAAYRQARTGQTPEDLAWYLWNMAPPGGSYRGLTYTR